MAETTKPAKNSKSYDGFSEEERAAMKERAKELKAEARRAGADAKTQAEVIAKIADMTDADRVIAEKIHTIVTENAPDLRAKLWYGMPAYAQPGKDGKIICFFQEAAKFETRYATLAFNDSAKLDDGNLWPSAFAITSLTAADEKMIAELVKRAVG